MSRVPMSLFHAAAEREKEESVQHHVEMIKQGQSNIFEATEKLNRDEAKRMKEQALTKLRGEMANSANNSYVQVIGEVLMQHIEANPANAEKFIDEKKTIAASLQVMTNEAQKKKQGNMAVLTDAEGFAIVLKYFGIDAPVTITTTQPVAQTQSAVATPVMAQVPVEQEKPKKRFDASMDDFWD